MYKKHSFTDMLFSHSSQFSQIGGILGILLLLYSVQVTALDTIREDVAITISHHHYLHPPLEELLSLKTSEINTYLQKLDPYSHYFSPEAYKSYQKKRRRGRIKIGLGINMLGDEEQLIVVPLKKGPAYAAGLKRPQLLVSLNGKAVTLKTLISDAPPQFKLGTTIPIKVSYLPGGVVKRYNVKVSVFRQPAVELIHEAKVDMIRIHEFKSGETAKTLKRFINALIKAGKPIVVDLRYSPGGSLFEALDSVSLFLPPETPLITLVDNADYREPFSAVQGQVTHKLPTYLLMSPYTASSAEVFALILKHYASAILIGTRTQGKCLSQQLFDFEEGSALKLSVYDILGPDNRSCQEVGVVPDIQIEKRHITNTAVILKQGIEVVAKPSRFVCVETPYDNPTAAEAQLMNLAFSVNLDQEKTAILQGSEKNTWHACVGPFFTEPSAAKNQVRLTELFGLKFQIFVPFN